MVAAVNPLDGAVWVEIQGGETPKWPKRLRRWLVLTNGRVFVPVGTEDAKRAVKAGIAYAVHGGGMLVDSAWLLRQREGAEKRELAAMLEQVRRTARCD